MKNRTSLLSVGILSLFCLLFLTACAQSKTQTKIIFDTDFGGDADDLGALAMLNHFQNRGEIDLLAVMCWNLEKYCVPAIDAVNTYYGNPDIPIGLRDGEQHETPWNHSKVLAENLPHNATPNNVPEATELYRKLLSESDDNSVIIVTVGPLMNIKKLIDSKGDEYSSLNGMELINSKVKEFVIMGGNFPTSKDEWNFNGDMPGVTKYVLEHIDLPITFSGAELGNVIRTGDVFNQLPEDSPLYLGFYHFGKYAPWMNHQFKGKIFDNATFDQTAVLYAIRNGVGTYWHKITDGICVADDKAGIHGYPSQIQIIRIWFLICPSQKSKKNWKLLCLAIFKTSLMKNKLLLAIVLVSLSFNVGAQEKVILDTDPSFDPDDVGCIAMLQTMATNGECDILAIINSTDQKESALCISSINYFYNRKSIPVGDYKGYAEKINATENTYDFHIAKDYPRELKNWEDSYDGVELYREILESAKDTSITIVIIGTMHNFYGLLLSEPDHLSDKTGKELVAQKVKLVATMGGNFLDNKGYDRTNWGGADALCSYTDWSCLREERNRMCRYVIDNCPAPFMASGWENGNGDYHNAKNGDVITGQSLKQLPENHIVRKSYEKHFEYRGGADDISRHSNDQCALHYAIRGEDLNYTAYTDGKITLSEKGECLWDASINRKQGHIQKNRNDQLIAEEIDALMMGAIPELDQTPPTKPKNLTLMQKDGKKILSWEASEDATKGSWVVGYDIYKDGLFLHRAFGTKFGLTDSGKLYEIRAVNASGTESEAAIFLTKS